MNLSNEQLNSTRSSFSPAMVESVNVDETAQPPLAADGTSIWQSSYTAPFENEQARQQDESSSESRKTLGAGEICQPAMRIEIRGVNTPSTATTDGFFRQRPWQLRCSTELAGQRNFILNAPTAAGKTFELCAIAHARVEEDTDLRVVIAVPQAIIGAGFRNNRIEMPDGNRICWQLDPAHDLCSENARQSTVRLLKFLNGPASAEAMAVRFRQACVRPRDFSRK
jgi:hypothetical protein